MALTAGCLAAWIGIHTDLAAAADVGSVPAGPSTPSGARGPDEMRTFRQLAGLPSPGQIEDYRANRHKSVVELQQFRELTRLKVDGSRVARPWPA